VVSHTYRYQLKYGVRASSGGGRSSARETAARVAAGAVAERWLRQKYGTEIVAYVSSVADIDADPARCDEATLTREQVDKTMTRCPDLEAAARIEELVRKAKEDMDSVGGTVRVVVRSPPMGLGEPCFDKLEVACGPGA
jgi:chorismate synthase